MERATADVCQSLSSVSRQHLGQQIHYKRELHVTLREYEECPSSCVQVTKPAGPCKGSYCYPQQPLRPVLVAGNEIDDLLVCVVRGRGKVDAVPGVRDHVDAEVRVGDTGEERSSSVYLSLSFAERRDRAVRCA